MTQPESMPGHGREMPPHHGRILYLHGFRSSPDSFKARLLAKALAERGLKHRFHAPALPVSPRAALQALEAAYAPGPQDTLIGSSLGGCYATVLAARHGCRLVLLNPALRPAEGLSGYIGWQTFFHDPGRGFEWTAAHVQELRELQPERLSAPERTLLIAATGDELLDWREMLAFCQGADCRVIQGSDHGLSDFADHLEAVLAFAGLP
ncbi:MAG: YqiA/YcfP family alpha/beta fold hydrolase [Burkholderiaceae bacterium]